MPYTIWSRGRLLGETNLDYVRCIHRHRTGDFHPSEFGETLMLIFTEPSVALRALGKLGSEFEMSGGSVESRRERRKADPTWVTAQADYDAAIDRREGLSLELRGPTGAVIPTEWIDIRDTEYLAALGEELAAELELEPLDPEIEAAVEHDLAVLEEEGFFDDDEPWRGNEPRFDRPPARYQIHVALLDDMSVP